MTDRQIIVGSFAREDREMLVRTREMLFRYADHNLENSGKNHFGENIVIEESFGKECESIVRLLETIIFRR